MRPPVPVTGVTRAYQSDSSSKPPHRRAAPAPQDIRDVDPPPAALAAPHRWARYVAAAGGQRTVGRIR